MVNEALYDWFEADGVAIPREAYRSLPDHPAYKLELLRGALHVSPRWRTHVAFLRLADLTIGPEPEHRVRTLGAADWDVLPDVFARSFASAPPFSMLDLETRTEAARGWLTHARAGGDGPTIDPACVVAEAAEGGPIVAAAIVTRLDGPAFRSYATLRARLGGASPPVDRPFAHLTWIFVLADQARRGVGSSLLAASARALRDLGHDELATTIHRGNDAAMAWHWRHGFRLAPNRPPNPKPGGDASTTV